MIIHIKYLFLKKLSLYNVEFMLIIVQIFKCNWDRFYLLDLCSVLLAFVCDKLLRNVIQGEIFITVVNIITTSETQALKYYSVKRHYTSGPQYLLELNYMHLMGVNIHNLHAYKSHIRFSEDSATTLNF